MRIRYLPLVLLSVAGVLGAEPARDRFGDPLPEGAIARMGSLRLRSEFVVHAAAFSPDGKTLATAGDGPSICFWDTVTGKELRRVTVKSPRLRIKSLWFGAEGKTLILAGDHSSLRVVDAATGAEKQQMDRAVLEQLLTLDVTRDGKTAAVLRSPDAIDVWDIPAGKLLHEFKGPKLSWRPSYDKLMALTPDGRQLVLPHEDGSLRLMDLTSGKEVFAFEAPPGRVRNQLREVAVSPDGRYLASGGWGHSVALCDLKTGRFVRALESTRDAAGLAFTPDSRFLAVSLKEDIRLFLLSGKEVRKFALPSGLNETSLFSPDGRTLASFGSGPLLHLWDAATSRLLHKPDGHTGPIQSLAYFPDGKRLASADRTGGDLIVWDTDGGQELVRHRKIYVTQHTLGAAGDGETVHFLASDKAVHRWRPRTGHEEKQELVSPRESWDKRPIALSADGRSVVMLSDKDTPQATLRDLKEKVMRPLTLPAKVKIIQFPRLAPDGRRLAAVCSDQMLRVWDGTTGKQLWEQKTGLRLDLAFAGDGKRLALSEPHRVRLVETDTGVERLVLPPTAVELTALAYSSDARFLAYGQADGDIVVYGTATGKQLAHWRGRQGSVYVLAFSRDSRQLASGGENGTILVWKLPGGEDLPATLKPTSRPRQKRGHF